MKWVCMKKTAQHKKASERQTEEEEAMNVNNVPQTEEDAMNVNNVPQIIACEKVAVLCPSTYSVRQAEIDVKRINVSSKNILTVCGSCEGRTPRRGGSTHSVDEHPGHIQVGRTVRSWGPT